MGVGFGTRRIRSYARTRRRAEFSQSIVDALTSQVAVVDATGSVAAMNEAWRRQTVSEESPLWGCGLGNSFLEVGPKVSCVTDTAAEGGLAGGIREVLASDAVPAFEVEYAFGEASKRWFVLRVTRFVESGTVWGVVEQEEITARKQAELEVERSRAVYQELATRDELTGLYNRRALDQLLAEEVGRHERYGNLVALAMVDIDHFKRVNDEYGHVVGDAALKWLTELLARNVRVVDKVARYGGEEFAIIAPELSAGEAWGMAERLRGMIVSHPFRYTLPDGRNLQLPITVSFGVAAIPGDVEGGAELVLAADKALYAAKRCGRNCSVQFRELEEPLVS
jgi:diguanylate cyclase (GGDEF)-like protein